MRKLTAFLLAFLMALPAGTAIRSEETPGLVFGSDALQRDSVIWFGGKSETEPLLTGWRVMKTEEDGSILMLSDRLFEGIMKFNADFSKNNAYIGSDLQKRCIALYDSWPSAVEKKAILPTYITETGGYSNTGPVSIDGDYFYVPSKREVEKELFSSPEERGAYKADEDDYGRWWTRSPSSNDRKFAAWVESDTYDYIIGNYQIDNNAYFRPAFHLDSSKVLFASGAKPDSAEPAAIAANTDNHWKLTLLDEERSFSILNADSFVRQGEKFSISYSGAVKADGEYISVIFCEEGKPVYYASVPVEAGKGTAEFSVPADLKAGNYSLKVFNEKQYPDKMSDVSSNIEEAQLTVIQAFKVTFETDGGTEIPAQTVTIGEKAEAPADPEKEGFMFEGWFKDSALTEAYDFSTAVTENLTLYAKWHEHKWSEPVYTWSKDNTTVTAERVCADNAEHVEKETVKTTAKVIKEATFEEEGETTYTAAFRNKAFSTQSKTVVVPKRVIQIIEMYRVYNPNSGEHFYTAKEVEKNVLVEVGWIYEGVGWHAPEYSHAPVYRLYNKFGGEHHYTTNSSERDALVKAGWTDEGIGWYSDEKKTVPLYRQYNPNAYSCNHNYTANKKENDALVKLGWKEEGIGWYGSQK